MSDSILEQSKKAKGLGGFGKKAKVLVIILILIAGAYYGYSYYTKSKSNTGLQVTREKTASASRGDIQLAVDADGKVVAEDGVDLSFSATGETVEQIYVKVGDMVKKGDKIASISATSLERDLKNAQDSYQSALLEYDSAKAGASEKDTKNAQYQIEQAQTSLDQSKTSLQQTQTTLQQTQLSAEDKVKSAQQAIDTANNNLKNASQSNSDAVDSAYDTLFTDIGSLDLAYKNNLYSADKILGIDDASLNDKFENVLGVLNSSSLNSSKTSYNQAKNSKAKLDSMLTSSDKSDQSDIDKLSAQASATNVDFKTLFANLQDLLDSTITSSNFSQSDLDSLKSGVSSARSSINGNESTLSKDTNAIKTAEENVSTSQTSYNNTVYNLQVAYNNAVTNVATVKRQNEVDIANAQTNITNAQTAIRNKEIALDQANLSCNDLKAPLTTLEKQNYVTKINQAKNSLEKVQQSVADTTLTSPIDGEVGAINGKVGSLVSSDSTKSFATIINKDTLFVEVSVEESEISNIKQGQKAYVTFDAINGLQLEGEVTFISMTATTSNSGIVTYVVRVVLNDVGKTEVKEGMTAFVKFVSSEVKDVINIPVAAVTNVSGVASVKLENGTYREVVTGFTDGKTVEIVSGLDEGEKIVY